MTLGSKTRPPRHQLRVARAAGIVVIKVIGAGNMATAPALNEFIEQETEAGFRRFIFDLEQCRGLDSTFMGCMVGLCTDLVRDNPAPPEVGPGIPDEALTTGQPQQTKDGPPPPDDMESDAHLEPMSPQEALAALRRTFASPQGSAEIFDGFVIAVNVSEECREVLNILGVDKFVRIHQQMDLGGLEVAELPEPEISADERRRLILKAHENLVEIDKRNEAQFGAFLKALSDELSKK